VRERLDRSVLRIVKSGTASAAAEVSSTCAGLAATQTARQPVVFWKVAAGFFEALALGLIPVDVYVKRAASRVLLQYVSLARGDMGVSDRLAHDLVFFCSQAVPADPASAPHLEAVRQAYSLGLFVPVNYEVSLFGQFDPALLAQARRRIGAAKDTWSALSGGDTNKLKAVADQFSLVADSLVKLHPSSEPLALAMGRTVEMVVRSGEAPGPELAMEVATSVLYLEAVFEDIDPNDTELARRTARLADRLEKVRSGTPPEPLEVWMEELYRRVSDRQTMGSVVGELRVNLGELEKSLDQFFRNPQEKLVLRDVPGQLAQMRGVLSVLGLDQASQAVQRMRESVEEILVTEIDEERARATGTFDKLGNNLGALGFLIDMLNYQPALAKQLFVYDDDTGELKPLMGRAPSRAAPPDAVAGAADLAGQALGALDSAGVHPGDQLAGKLDTIAAHAALADQPQLARTAREASDALVSRDSSAATQALTELASVVSPSAAVEASPVVQPDFEEDDLKNIFIEEAREVIEGGLAAVAALRDEPGAMGDQTTLRRAFHTLKGSSRMVGLTEYGEAAWSMEQVLNGWLAEQKPVSPELITLSASALEAFGRWINDIDQGADTGWKASAFRDSAEPMRLEGRLVPLVLPEPAPVLAAADVVADFELPDDAGAASEMESESRTVVLDSPSPPATEVIEIEGIDFASLSEASGPAQPPAATTEPAPVLDDFDFDLGAALDPPADLPPPATAQEAAPSLPETEAIVELDDFATLLTDPAPEVSPSTAASLDVPESDADQVPADQVRVIGDLRIGIPLYNVYLNEADEWSRRLRTEVAEWSLELGQPLPESTVGLAHALSGASATVGFSSLSDLAKTLEHAMSQSRSGGNGGPHHAAVFSRATEEIHRVLHQFAAGFLAPVDEDLMQALRDIWHEPTAPVSPSESGFGDLDFGAALAPPVVTIVAPSEPPAVVELSTPEPVRDPEPAPAGQPDFAPEPEPPALLDAVPAPAMPVQPVPQQPVAAQVAPLPGARAAADRLEDEHDEIDETDVIDPDLFPIFEEEGAELLPTLGGALRQWIASPSSQQPRAEVLRALHTLKGSARLTGALRLGEMAHRMESEVERVEPGGGAAQIEPLLARFDALQTRFEALRHVDQVALPDDTQQQPAPSVVTSPGESASDAVRGDDRKVPASPARALAAVAIAPLVTPRTAASQSVRVRSQLLDRLVNQAGEVMITRSRLEAELGQLRGSLGDLTGNLDRLRQQLRDIELQAETQMQSRLAQARDSAAGFDPLEFDRFTRVQELTRMMAESVNDVATVQRNLQRTVEATEDDLIAQARQTRELQRDLLRTRMVEFEGISERLYRVVRQASKETGKQVKLDITGGSIEMDRGVLDRMTPAFEHLLRNCVAHGIEDPSTRVAAGKDATGVITIGLAQEGNDVSVEFRDDGAGLNLPRIREKAVSQGLIGPGQELSNAEAANLIFMPGFSTATEVTGLAGRGIGMDVVRSEVTALGGRIETTTESGKGAGFKMVLPLTTAVTQVVMLRSGTLSIGVPANVVEIVRRATTAELQLAYNTGFHEFMGEQVPFFWSGALLQSSRRSSEPQGRTTPVVVFRSAAQRVAVHVDEVLGNQEVVVKNLGPQLARLPGLAGMTVLASGAVALIYNPVALAAVFGAQARALSADQAQPEVLEQSAQAAGSAVPVLQTAAPQIPLVLVVDDSITVRRVTQRLLQREGYRVSLAADGLQALERLQEERPAVVLSDIEMPRMDGFDLARNIRADARLGDLPIVMITSRIAEKHREHAMELGVNHYLGKPYAEEELLSLVRHYTSEVPA
jgi:chemosensory pili system protein ChpA (sensor histidine kinase/response regulator)